MNVRPKNFFISSTVMGTQVVRYKVYLVKGIVLHLWFALHRGEFAQPDTDKWGKMYVTNDNIFTRGNYHIYAHILSER